MDVSPKQIVSVATALIPFLEHDDANRALMGANMQRQAVPVLRPHRADHRHRDGVPRRQGLGRLRPRDGQRRGPRRRRRRDHRQVRRPVRARAGRPTGSPSSALATRGRASTSGRSSSPGDVVKRARVLADGPSTEDGELALGQNVLVAFMPWEGLQLRRRDPHLASGWSRTTRFTSIHIEEYESEARDTKLGAEEITRDIPNVGEDILKDLDEDGHHPHRRRGRSRRHPRRQGHAEGRDRADRRGAAPARDLRREVARSARHLAESAARRDGKIIDVKQFSREDGDELSPGVNQLVRVYVAQKRKIQRRRQDGRPPRQQGRHRQDPPEEDMPYLADGTPVDIVLNPLGVPSRMNVGQILETHLGYAARYGWEGQRLAPRSERKTRHDHRACGVGEQPRLRRRALGRGRPGRCPGDHREALRADAPRRRERHAPRRQRRQDARSTTARPASASTGRSPSATSTC